MFWLKGLLAFCFSTAYRSLATRSFILLAKLYFASHPLLFIATLAHATHLFHVPFHMLHYFSSRSHWSSPFDVSIWCLQHIFLCSAASFYLSLSFLHVTSHLASHLYTANTYRFWPCKCHYKEHCTCHTLKETLKGYSNTLMMLSSCARTHSSLQIKIESDGLSAMHTMKMPSSGLPCHRIQEQTGALLKLKSRASIQEWRRMIGDFCAQIWQGWWKCRPQEQ